MGFIGLIIFMFGLSNTNADSKNIIILCATALLFTSALIQQEPFFVGLQGIAFVNACMVFYAFSPATNISVFLVLSFIFAIV